MVTLRQLCRDKKRQIKKKKLIDKGLKGNPQKKAICLKLFVKSPKKPNSANRKVAKVEFSNKYVTTAYIPGEGHNLQEHSTVLVRGGRTQDLPGLRYKIIRNVYDCKGVLNRKTSRSKYGANKNVISRK